MGLFYPFIEDEHVKMYGIEARGLGIPTHKHCAAVATASTGILHGTMTELLQDPFGQITEAFSISAGLDYPGVGPEHSHLHDIKRVTYDSITDEEALEAFKLLSDRKSVV